MLIWALLAACGEPPNEVLLYSEGDGALCIDAASATLSIDKDCALTCAESTWQGRCEPLILDPVEIPGTPPTVGVALVVRSEILVNQPEGCAATTCESARVTCDVPADAAGLPVLWGSKSWAGLSELDTCLALPTQGDTGAE